MSAHDPMVPPSGPAPVPALPGGTPPRRQAAPVPTVALPPAPLALGRAALAVAALWAALQVVVTVCFLAEFPEAQRLVVAGQEREAVVMPVTDLLSGFLSPAAAAAFVVSGLWLYQSRQFAQAVAPRYPHARRTVWVWLGWVVPIVALWFPLQVVRDVRAATEGTPSTRGLALWWSTWLLSFLTLDIWLPADPTLVPLLVSEVVTGLCTVVAAVMWFRIVRQIGAAQQFRLAHAGLRP